MILETFGLIKSAFPFIKEIFLWRDGAEVGKPITKKDLRRRQIASYVMAGSLFFNYILVYKTVHLAATIVESKKWIESANEELALYRNGACKQETPVAKAPVTVTTKDVGRVVKHIVKHGAH